jgi:hypothetical protein
MDSGVFCGRKEELDFLSDRLNDLIEKDKGGIIFLWGAAGLGKTALLQEFIKNNKRDCIIYLEGKKIFSLPPDIGGEVFLHQFLSQIFSFSASLLQEWYSLRKDEYEKKVNLILSLPFFLAETNKDKKIFLIWDDFYHIIKLEKNYTKKAQVIKSFIENWQKINYKSSNLTIILVSRGNYPFFSDLLKEKGVINYQLKPLSLANSYELMERFIENLEEEAKLRLYELTEGVPFYLISLLEAKKNKPHLNIDELFQEEQTKYHSKIYSFLYSVIEEGMHIARGGPLAYALLEKMANFYPEGKDVKELSIEINRDYAVVREMLHRLSLTNLIEVKSGKYRLTHPFLAYFFPSNQNYIGRRKLAELCTLLLQAQAKRLPEELFANPQPIELPIIEKVELFHPDLRATLFCKNDKIWLLSVKWEEEPLEEVELLNLLNEKRRLQLNLPYREVVLLCLSKSGYSTSALMLAKEEGILVSIPEDIKLFKILLGAPVAQ